MKNFIIEKGIIIATVFFSIHSSQQATLKVEPVKEKTTIVDVIKPPTNIDSLVQKDIEIMENYNNTVIKRNKLNSKSLELSKKDVENSKTIAKLIDEIISKNNKKEAKVCKTIITDTVCVKTKNRLFKKNKCIEREVTFFLIEGNKKTKLQTIKIK